MGAKMATMRLSHLAVTAKHTTPKAGGWIMMLLLLCGDVEVNPGQGSYPGAVCGQGVAEDDLAIEWDHCRLWCHAHCGGMSEAEYRALPDDSFDWVCPKCTVSRITENGSDEDIVEQSVETCRIGPNASRNAGDLWSFNFHNQNAVAHLNIHRNLAR